MGFVSSVLILGMENAQGQLKLSVPKFSEIILNFCPVEVPISADQPRLPLFIQLILEIDMWMEFDVN